MIPKPPTPRSHRGNGYRSDHPGHPHRQRFQTDVQRVYSWPICSHRVLSALAGGDDTAAVFFSGTASAVGPNTAADGDPELCKFSLQY